MVEEPVIAVVLTAARPFAVGRPVVAVDTGTTREREIGSGVLQGPHQRSDRFGSEDVAAVDDNDRGGRLVRGVDSVDDRRGDPSPELVGTAVDETEDHGAVGIELDVGQQGLWGTAPHETGIVLGDDLVARIIGPRPPIVTGPPVDAAPGIAEAERRHRRTPGAGGDVIAQHLGGERHRRRVDEAGGQYHGLAPVAHDAEIEGTIMPFETPRSIGARGT